MNLREMKQLRTEDLVGKTVKDAFVQTAPDVGDVPVLIFEDGTIALVWRDPEHNGAGHLDVFVP